MEPHRINLWVDDERTAPTGWIHARTAREAILVLRTHQVEAASLDHDLGDGPSGYDVLCWMERQTAAGALQPPSHLRVHSANPPGRERMRRAIAAIDRIARARAREDTSSARLAQLPAGFVQALTRAARQVCGDRLEALILYGSRAHGVPGADSDIDLCVALADGACDRWAVTNGIRSAIGSDLQIDIELGLYIESIEELCRYADLPETMQWKIAHRGLVLYGGLQARADAKRYSRGEVVTQWLSCGHRAVQVAYRLHEPSIEDSAGHIVFAESAYLGAAWALRAALLANSIDASDPRLRWQVLNLAKLLALVQPDAADLRTLGDAHLPYWLDHERYGLRHEPPTAKECSQAIVAAHHVLEATTAAAECTLGTDLVESRRELLIEALQKVFSGLDGVAVLLGPLPLDPRARAPLRLFVASNAARQTFQSALDAVAQVWGRRVELEWLSAPAFAIRMRQGEGWPAGRIVLRGDASAFIDAAPGS